MTRDLTPPGVTVNRGWTGVDGQMPQLPITHMKILKHILQTPKRDPVGMSLNCPQWGLVQ